MDDKELISNLNRHPIIFFDGVCGICNKFVDIILKADKNEIFFFAPIQGETAKRILQPLSSKASDWSMIYVDENGIYQQSDASLQICRRMGGSWKILGYLLLIPRVIRNPVYRLIAKNRYKLFGKRDSCRLPSEKEKERFLP